MSGADDPKPPRTLVGQPVHEPSPDETDPQGAPPELPGIAPGLDSTLPMGSASLRKELQATLAAGPAAAAAKLAAARAAEPNPSSTAPMGSAAIKKAAEASPPAGKGPLAFTAKGTPPSTHELAEAIAKAASEHAERTRSSTQNPHGSPVGVVAHDYGDPNARKQTTPGSPGSDPAIRSGTPAPAVPATGRTPTPGYGSPGARTSSADLPPDSMFARPKSPTGPNHTPSFAPSGGYQQPGSNPAVPSGGYAQQPGSNPAAPSGGYAQQPGSNPAVPSGGYAQQPGSNPAVPSGGYAQQVGSNPAVPSGGYAQQPGSNPAVPSGGYAQQPSNPATYPHGTNAPPPNPANYPHGTTAPNPASGYAQQPGSNPAIAPGYAEQPRKPPTGPRAAVDPAAFAPQPSSYDPSRAAVDPTAYDTSRAKPPTGPNPAVDPTAFASGPASYDPSRGKPPTNPTPGTDPTAYAGPPSYDPSRGRPPTNPNPGTDPTAYGGPASHDPSRDPTAYQRRPVSSPSPHAVSTAQGYVSPGADPRNKPPTGPNPAVDPSAFAPKPGSNPAAAVYDPSRPRPPTNPNPAVAHDPTMYTAPGPAAPPVIHTSPNDRTMMAAQAPVIAERPRIATEGLRPVTETLREVAVENYEITDEIARGGMGRILRAKDVRLHRQVAIKELLGDNAHFKARFERETLITARLQHPAIVPIYDAGRWPTGELFYTMKLVAGKPLETLIDNVGGISERLRLLPNMIAVAEALAYAHTNNIVHRDLKPANILVGDFGETIVIDWGLAKDLTTNDAAEPAGPFRSPAVGAMGATVAGSVMGTPAYMPLEQGRGLQVDARADVYAIGAVLYHVLSKRAPYDGPDGMSILQALLKEPPPPLSAIAPDVPAELQAIVAKAMAREPEGRYPTCRELVDDLRRYQNGQMVGVHRYTSRELFKRWAKKHKGALAVAALSFVVLAVVGVIAISRVVSANRDAQRERDIALEQSKAALEARAAAEVSEARAKKSESQAAEERDRQRFARERRVEFNHFEHTQLRKCAECHPTDPKTFTALAGHPGHAECKGCHDEKSMEGLSNDPKCAFCHIDRVATTKDHTSLRACDDGSVRALKSAGGKVAPCFPHDLKAHRFADDGKPLDCTTCHAVLAEKEKWGAKRYVSLQDLDTNTIIGQGPAGGVDAMHKACSIGCHAHVGQTGQGPGETNCSMCHPKRSAVTF